MGRIPAVYNTISWSCHIKKKQYRHRSTVCRSAEMKMMEIKEKSHVAAAKRINVYPSIIHASVKKSCTSEKHSPVFAQYCTVQRILLLRCTEAVLLSCTSNLRNVFDTEGPSS
ncbi:hypothetical protein QTP88_015852 [Uroleucon formosanum]